MFKIIKDNPNVLFICAAGNSNVGLNVDKIYPTSYNLSNIISVNSIDNTGKLYQASGYGKNVDIAAPGVQVKVYLPNNQIAYVNGTSISTAIVSAVAAEMLSIDNKLTPSSTKK